MKQNESLPDALRRLADGLKHGYVKSQRNSDVQICTSLEEAATLLTVSRRSAASAKKVLDEGCDELIAMVDGGELAVSKAATITKKADTPKTQVAMAKEKPAKAKPTALEKVFALLAKLTKTELQSVRKTVEDAIAAHPAAKLQESTK